MQHHTFESSHHCRTLEQDFNCWHKLRDAFSQLHCHCPDDLRHLLPGDLERTGYVFLRLKEIDFVSDAAAMNGEQALTIAGFYYMVVERATGAVDAWYFDPGAQPLQRLQLAPKACGESGRAGVTSGRVLFM